MINLTLYKEDPFVLVRIGLKDFFFRMSLSFNTQSSVDDNLVYFLRFFQTWKLRTAIENSP